MRVPKKSTGTYKKRPFFPLNLHSLPNLPSLLSPPTCLTCPTSLTCPTIASAARTPTSLTSPTIASTASTPNPPSLFNSFRKISSIASLYLRYKKDTRSPKDYRKMSEAQTSNHRLKTRKTSYANLIHNLFRFSHSSQSFQPSHLSHLTKKILCNCRKN